MNDLVEMKNGVPMVGSELVAKKFGKVHRDVMRAINNLGCSEEFKLRNFAQGSYEVRGSEYESVNMTKDGFAFLCMGFTGKEAAKWKEAYIDAFNAMEKGLVNADERINKLTIDGRQIKQAGKEWSELGHEIRRQKKAHNVLVENLMSDVQFSLGID